MLADRKLKVPGETVGVSKHRLGYILHEILGMRKLLAQWMPRLLSSNNKHDHFMIVFDAVEV